MAYYGPNATLFAGIKSEYFGSRPVENVQKNLLVLLAFFSIDVFAMIASAILLWIYTKTNLFQEICKFLKNYWFILILKTLAATNHWSTLDINAGGDNQLQFDWITEEGRRGIILNSTTISDEEKCELLETACE